MLAAGMPHESIVAAVADMEASIATTDPVAEKRRAYDRERKRLAKINHSTGIPPESAETAELVPVLDKETSPRPPKEINPTPRVISTLTRKAGGFGPPTDVELGLWNEFCGQRKKPLTQNAYSAILAKLAEAAEAGWPPGDLFVRALEGGWETIFVPKESKNGRSGSNNLAASNRQRGSDRQDGFLSAIRQAADSFGPNDCGGMPRASGLG